MSQYQKTSKDSSDLADCLFPSCPIDTRIHHLFPFYRRKPKKTLLQTAVASNKEAEDLSGALFPSCSIDTKVHHLLSEYQHTARQIVQKISTIRKEDLSVSMYPSCPMKVIAYYHPYST
jgi:hypothetical protein